MKKRTLEVERDLRDRSSEYDSGSDIEYETDRTYKGKVKEAKRIRSFFYTGAIILLLSATVIILRSDLFPFLTYSEIYKTLSNYFPDKQKGPEEKTMNTGNRESAELEPIEHGNRTSNSDPHFNPTTSEIKKAYEALLTGKARRSGDEASELPLEEKHTNELDLIENYYYIIATGVGEDIRTDNIRITEQQVLFTDPKGYEIAIDRSRIVSVKRYAK